jgi:glycosyltransferase involved in cell wall biosynthesis
VGTAIQRVLPYNDQIPWASYAASAAGQLVSKIRPVAMLSTSPPVACHIAALWTKWRFGTPWIADFRDPFFANPLRPRKLSRPYEAILERLIVSNADAVIANTDSAAEILRHRYPGFERKIHTIWNGYDPKEALRALPLPKRDHKVLLHAGTLYAARHPNKLIGSLDRLIERGRINPDDIRLRLIGWQERTSEPWTQQPAFAALRSRGCLQLEGEVPQEEAVREMAQADYLLLLDLNDTGISVQVPAKLFQYIRIGRPILAYTSAQSPCERILDKSGIPHINIQSGASEDRMDEGVASLFALPSEPSRPSAWFEEQFNAEMQTKTLASIIQAVRI